jgi:hypothetical protein
MHVYGIMSWGDGSAVKEWRCVMEFSSEPDTRKHIARVNELLHAVVSELLRRADRHDATKLESPEKEVFDDLTPKLNNTTYNSDEYKKFLEELKPALDHHYANSRHHPEHYPRGIRDMTLMDLIEMLCDWKAASERHNDGNIRKSLEDNSVRFGYGAELNDILSNTVRELGLE